MALALALLISYGCGAALASTVFPRGFPSALGLKLSLSVGFGIGIFSLVFFICRVLDVTRLLAADLIVFMLLLIVAFVQRKARVGLAFQSSEDFCFPRWLRCSVVTAFSVALFAALYNGILRAVAYPNGEGWDAFAIWNLHARFLFRGGTNWRDGFSGLIPWSHPDYPLLLPAAIAHFWSYLGHETPLVPWVIGLLFTFGTIAVLFSSLVILRGRIAAMLGGLSLVSTPFFIEQGTSQYADVPLGFFFLAAIALLSMHDARSGEQSAFHSGFLVLSGLAAGFAAWTKNEGLLFLFALVLAALIANLWTHANRTPADRDRAPWRAFATVVVSALPALIVIFWFKHFIAPPGDLLASSNKILPKLLSPARYWAICKWYAKDFFRFGRWLVLPGTVLMIVLYLFRDRNPARRPVQPGFRTGVLTLALTLGGYFAVYLITPYDIFWHLRFSLDRLFLQLWPSAVFLFFLRMPWAPVASEQGQAPVSQS